MKHTFLSAFVICLLCSCSNNIAQPKDYEAYLTPSHLAKAVEKNNTEILFWQALLAGDTASFVNLLELGYNYIGLHKLKGDVAHLAKGDSLIKLAASKLKNSDPEILQALSQVAITQHRFQQAAQYNNEAFEKEASPYIHSLLSFDVGMELGQYGQAKQALGKVKDATSFDMLIRQAKYSDHTGDLESAIVLMESAFEKVKETNKVALYCWALSNLGDMYGHAGRIEESYAAYLKVLQKDPAYLYALKGIAWIAYSHDKNITEAKRIYNFINNQTQNPDLYLTLAEIEEYEGVTPEKDKWIEKFLAEATQPQSGVLYHKALIEIYTGEKPNLAEAMRLATWEVESRPTPETYSWLAWVHFRKGSVAKAYELFNLHVKGRTFEPEVLLKGAYIMEAAGYNKEAEAYFKECKASGFELGPVITKALQKR
jgi:tetratricopeptide (TPR) repeat protein